MKVDKKLNTDLQDHLNEYFKNFPVDKRPVGLFPEYNPDNWSDDYKAFRAKYPDDWHKRFYYEPRVTVCQEPEKPTELDYSMLNACDVK